MKAKVLHYLKVHTVDEIQKLDPRRDTGGLGQVIKWGMLKNVIT